MKQQRKEIEQKNQARKFAIYNVNIILRKHYKSVERVGRCKHYYKHTLFRENNLTSNNLQAS